MNDKTDHFLWQQLLSDGCLEGLRSEVHTLPLKATQTKTTESVSWLNLTCVYIYIYTHTRIYKVKKRDAVTLCEDGNNETRGNSFNWWKNIGPEHSGRAVVVLPEIPAAIWANKYLPGKFLPPQSLLIYIY